MDSVAILKSSRAQWRTLLVALILNAAQILPAQTYVQGSVDYVTNLASGGQDGLAFSLQWSVPVNGDYFVQSSTNLADPTAWVMEDLVEGAIGPVKWMAPELLRQAKFYRLIAPQTQIFSAEPSVLPAGTNQTVLLAGQLFPTNVTVLVNGTKDANVTVADSSDILVTFDASAPGAYILTVLASGEVVSTATVDVYDPSAPPASALREPPEDPPASPVTPACLALSDPNAWDVDGNGGLDRLTLAGADLDVRGWDPDNKQAVIGSPTKTSWQDGKTTAEDSWLGGIAAPDRGGSSAGGGAPPLPGLMRAREKANQIRISRPMLMKAREKANRTKCGVSLSSGEVQAQATDLIVPGVGLDFVWARTYRSRTGPDSAVGARWDYSYDIASQTNSRGVAVFDGGGRVDLYQPQGNGTYACAGCFREGTLTNNAFRLTFADGSYWAFWPFDGSATAGRIAQIVDRNANALSFVYNSAGQLAAVLDTLNRKFTINYNTTGQIASVVDFGGRSVTYQYYTGGTPGGSAGDLASATSPVVTGTPNGNDFPSGKTTTYTYSSGYAQRPEDHLLLSVTDPLGQTAHMFTYQHSTNDFNYLRCIQEQRGNNGQVIMYDWEAQTPQPGQYAVIKCLVNDAVGNVSEYYYDSLNRLVRALDFTGRATPGVKTTSLTNRPLNPVRTTDPAYFETDWQWNNDSLCTRETEPGGDFMQFVYQGDLSPTTPARFRANMLVKRRRKPPGDTVDAVQFPNGLETHYQYDPRFGTEPAPSSGGHTGNLRGNHKDCMMICGTVFGDGSGRLNRTRLTFGDSPAASDERAGNLHGNHKDCMMLSAYVSPNTGKPMLVLVGPVTKSRKDMLQWVADIAPNDPGPGGGAGVGIAPGGSSPGDGYRYYKKRKLAESQAVCFPVRGTDPRFNQTVSTYDSNGNLIHLEHSGNALSGQNTVAPEDFTYNAAGQMLSRTLPDNGSGYRRMDQAAYYPSGPQKGFLQSVTVDSAGVAERTTFQHDPYGNVVQCSDPLGNAYLYTINALNQVVQEESPPVSTTLLVSYTNQFTYDANDNLVGVTTPGIDEKGAADPTATGLTAWTYDVLDFVTSQTGRIDNTHNAVIQFQYDANRNLTNIMLPEAVNGNDPFNTISCQYDERDLLFKRVRAQGSPLQSTDQFDVTLDKELGRGSFGLEATPEIETYYYDGFERLVVVRDAMGNAVTNLLDPSGNVLSQTIFGPTNQSIGAASVVLAETTFSYDNLNRLTQCNEAFFNLATGAPIGSGQSSTSFAYDGGDDVTSWSDAHGQTTLLVYDTVSRLSTITDARGNRLQYTYDANDNVASQTETDQNDLGGASQAYTLMYHYDNLNRRATNTDNVENNVSFAYNSRNDLTVRTDARGNSSFFQFDGLNRCTAAIADMNRDGIPDLADIVIHAGYDADSRLISSTDPNGNQTAFLYDSLNRVVKTQWPDGSFGTRAFDPHNNPIRCVDQNGTVVSNSFDLLNRRTGMVVLAFGSSAATNTSFESYAYDGQSRLVGWTNDAASCQAAYDSLGDCVSESLNGQTTTSSFDAVGNRLALTYPGGTAVGYTYDSLNRQTNVSGGGVTIETVSYVGPDRLAARQYANGTGSLFSYDGVLGTTNASGDYGWRQVSGVLHQNGTNLLDERLLRWDPNGNQIERDQTAVFATNGAGPLQEAFSYDPANRLIEATVLAPNSGGQVQRQTQYALDNAGNRTNVSGLNETCGGDYTLNAVAPGPENFQLNEYTTTGCDSRQYNPDQDLITITSSSGVVSLGYDVRDRLVSFTNSLTQTGATYAYDALGRRIHKTVYSAGGTRQSVFYVYDGSHAIEQRDTNGTVVATFVLDGTRSHDLAAVSRAAQTYYFHTDDLGNVLDLTDAKGNVVERYEYDDYGLPQFLNPQGSPETGPTGPAIQSSLGNPYLFRGFRWDAESGLYQLGEAETLNPEPVTGDLAQQAEVRVEKIKFKQEFGPTQANKRNLCLEPKSGRAISPSATADAHLVYFVERRRLETASEGEQSGCFTDGNAFDFANNNPWSSGGATKGVVRCRGANSLNVFLQR